MHDYIHAFHPQDDAVEPKDVKILSLNAKTLENPQKVRVTVQVTPFQSLPDLFFAIYDEQNGTEVSSVNMIESVLDQINFVMHIRKNMDSIVGPYKLVCQVIYRDIGIVDSQEFKFQL